MSAPSANGEPPEAALHARLRMAASDVVASSYEKCGPLGSCSRLASNTMSVAWVQQARKARRSATGSSREAPVVQANLSSGTSRCPQLRTPIRRRL
jgi:hypothetical protein